MRNVISIFSTIDKNGNASGLQCQRPYQFVEELVTSILDPVVPAGSTKFTTGLERKLDVIL